MRLSSKLVSVVLFITFLSLRIVAQNPYKSINVDVSKPGEAFDHYWSKCVGAGRANEGLRASWLEHLAKVKKECGFEYCRFHGLFHDDMFVYREVNTNGKYQKGNVVYNWQYTDELFDRMLDIGVKPFVELGFFPKDIAKEDSKTVMWWKQCITPPDSLDKWSELVFRFTKHCVERYGIDEVKTWYFEVWNEPNLKGFWDSDQQHYFELYKVTANAVKKVNSQLRVGGPATSSFKVKKVINGKSYNCAVWVEDFLAYCEKEKLPVDFVSAHPYPHEWAFDAANEGKDESKVSAIDVTVMSMQWMKDLISKSAFPKAEIHYTEWSTSASSRDKGHDNLPAAAYVIKANLMCLGLTQSLSYWTFTDVFEEKGAGNTIFHGGFGMINYQGITKPTYHAYRMLNALGDQKIYYDNDFFVSRNSKTKKISAILIHYPSEMKGQGVTKTSTDVGTPKLFSIHLTGLQANAKFEIEIVDKSHANAMESWIKMGSPEPPLRKQVKTLKEEAETPYKETIQADNKGNLIWNKTLEPWACVLIKNL